MTVGSGVGSGVGVGAGVAVSAELPLADSSLPPHADSISAAISTRAMPVMFRIERNLVFMLPLFVYCDELPQITRQVGAISPIEHPHI